MQLVCRNDHGQLGIRFCFKWHLLLNMQLFPWGPCDFLPTRSDGPMNLKKSGVVFILFFFVLCTICCQFLLIVHFWLPLPRSLTFIHYCFIRMPNIKIVERGKINTPNTQIHDLAWYSHFNQIITSFMGSNPPSLWKDVVMLVLSTCE
jgi:hypothetical protein